MGLMEKQFIKVINSEEMGYIGYAKRYHKTIDKIKRNEIFKNNSAKDNLKDFGYKEMEKNEDIRN